MKGRSRAVAAVGALLAAAVPIVIINGLLMAFGPRGPSRDGFDAGYFLGFVLMVGSLVLAGVAGMVAWHLLTAGRAED